MSAVDVVARPAKKKKWNVHQIVVGIFSRIFFAVHFLARVPNFF